MDVKGLGPIRVGISGLGRSGWGIHARTLPKLEDMYEVVAVMDPLPDRLIESFELLGGPVRGHATFEELLADDRVELIVVASPSGFHVTQTWAALEAGKHVVCEKPLAMNVADVDRSIELAARSGVILQPFQQRRYETDFQKVKAICESGLLGRIQFIRTCWHSFKRRWDWQTLLRTGGGELNNNGPHPIDHALELFGPAEPKVWCEKRRCLASGDAEDHVKIVLTADGAPTIEIELSSTVAYPQDRWLVCGDAGGLRGNADSLEWKWVDWTTMPDRPVSDAPTPDRSYNSEPLVWNSDRWTNSGDADLGGGAPPADAPIVAMYESLYRTIRQGAHQEITPQSIRRRVAVIEECHRLCPLPLSSTQP